MAWGDGDWAPADGEDEAAAECRLIEAFCAGDLRALETLYRRYGGAIVALGVRILGDQRDAEELLDDAFLRVYVQRGSYDPARGAFGGWLLRIARNLALDRWRSARRRLALPLDQLAPPSGAGELPLELSLRREQRQRMHQVLSALPFEEHELLVLSYWGELSHREIAGRLNLPLGTVKTRIRRAMAQLRSVLGEPEADPPDESDE